MREPFKEAFGPHCFYCGAHLADGNPIDHVLPWSLVGIDGLANLVLACTRCNGDKSGALPAIAIVDRALERDRDVLEQIASSIQWPTQRERVVAAARGIYRGNRRACRRGPAIERRWDWMWRLRRSGSARVRSFPADRAVPISRCE